MIDLSNFYSGNVSGPTFPHFEIIPQTENVIISLINFINMSNKRKL